MARTTRGLEWIAVAEIEGVVGVVPTAVDHREVRFSAPDTPRALLNLGTVDDIFAIAHEFGGIGRHRSALPVIAREAASSDVAALLPWLRQVRAVPDAPSFDVTASFVGKRNFNRFEIADTVGAAVATATGWTYIPRTREAGPAPAPVSLRMHLAGEHATLAVRVCDAPLHRRPYRQSSRSASLRPPVARALALLAGLCSGTVLLDPFCGAGTVVIEALLARGDVHGIGHDIDAGVVAMAQANAQRAGVTPHLRPADARSLSLDAGSVDRVATNPPWGLGVQPRGDAMHLWREVRRVLRPGGRVAVIAPAAVVAEAAGILHVMTVVESPVRLLGQEVEMALLGADDSVAVATQLFGAELEGSFARYGARPRSSAET